jgi:two-component system, chemotaxis family, chemotaxis protein CheY
VGGHRHSILLVEDEAGTRESLGVLLEQAGHSVLRVLNCKEALAALRGFRSCAILLDLAMPEKDGFEFRRRQLLDAQLAKVPVLVVSAGSYRQEAEARKLGMHAFFRKPMNLSAFTTVLHRACSRLT